MLLTCASEHHHGKVLMTCKADAILKTEFLVETWLALSTKDCNKPSLWRRASDQGLVTFVVAVKSGP